MIHFPSMLSFASAFEALALGCQESLREGDREWVGLGVSREAGGDETAPLGRGHESGKWS